MARNKRRWTLENLIDFEQTLASGKLDTTSSTRTVVAEAVKGKTGSEARRAGLHAWLEQVRGPVSMGRKFTSVLALMGAALIIFMWFGGVSAVMGMLDPVRGGINVTWFLAALIGGQWLVLVLAFVALAMRSRVGEGFSGLQALIGKLARRYTAGGEKENRWWRAVMDGGGAPRAVVLWRLARLAQSAGIGFNIGIICGLSGLVLFRQVGFYWETTTQSALEEGLHVAVKLLSIPWAAVFPAGVPDTSVIHESLWKSSDPVRLGPGPSQWWLFLLMTTFFWGLIPRLILWGIAWRSGITSLTKLDFQARHHRSLWRELTGVDRVETTEKPLDGVLVLDVGGSGLTEASLRPFMLRRLRVHPAAWHTTAVLDSGAEADAANSLALAPAGIVLLGEGWALSPPRMTALHSKIRGTMSAQTPLKFLVANADAAGNPSAPTDEERREWEKFVDSLRDPDSEVFFFDENA
ncbi:DUF2868 domain-containing protein [Luteolibacter pohnpeiensis]|uniref:DUF2868 domain-containing protein n=1 Tax=Luteolibacter pohnpeiensis TaxID=454153 RepID=A0A934S5I9_9BACT|nr:DUF2868 domain-containing protein [Luteolibacter pohnpeiensis]MBK1882253.1 DUF2868 domain-containing protein [Luteolibacter pohnpeiensis]